jgi:hypothetical protein
MYEPPYKYRCTAIHNKGGMCPHSLSFKGNYISYIKAQYDLVALHARGLVHAYGRARCNTTMQQLRTIVTPPFLLPASNCTTKVVIGAINIGVYPNDRAFFAAGGPVSATATQHILRLLRLDISAFNASSTTSPQQQVGRHQVLWPRVRGRAQRGD